MMLTFAALEQSEFNSPPRFILPEALDDPKNLAIVGNTSYLSNTLSCTVSNADHVEWFYSSTREGWMRPVPNSRTPPISHIIQHDIHQDINSLDLTRTITDRGANQAEREKLNGYYQCVATNRWNYKIESPPIRLIIPSE